MSHLGLPLGLRKGKGLVGCTCGVDGKEIDRVQVVSSL
jgi:hypothetical protein